MSNIVVLYHKSCIDGFTAAWAAWKVYPDATFIPVRHHEPFPDSLEGKDVFILDFCYSRSEMEELNNITNTLYCLDHHKTAYEQCKDLDYCHFDMDKSGAGLAWEFFRNNEDMPWLVEYVQYRDLGFLWTRPKSEHPPFLEEVLAAVDSYEKSFEQWDNFERGCSPDEEWKSGAIVLIREGQAILRYKKQLIDSAVRNATKVTIKGKKALSVNSCHFQSEIGNLLTRQEGAELGLVWYESEDRVKFSLRSIDEKEDVAAVAEQFEGGGGHRNAAGFAVKKSEDRFVVWLSQAYSGDCTQEDDDIVIPGWKDDEV